MSVLLIQGPRRPPATQSHVPPDLLRELAVKIRHLGSSLCVSTCDSATGLARCLRQSRANGVDVVLLDSGGLDALDCARHELDLRDALNDLGAPYIEIHDRSGCDLESRVRASHFASAIIVATRDITQGYAIAFGMVLRRMRNRQEGVAGHGERSVEA